VPFIGHGEVYLGRVIWSTFSRLRHRWLCLSRLLWSVSGLGRLSGCHLVTKWPVWFWVLMDIMSVVTYVAGFCHSLLVITWNRIHLLSSWLEGADTAFVCVCAFVFFCLCFSPASASEVITLLRATAATAVVRVSHRNSLRLSVRLFVTRVDQSKTVQARITKFLWSAAWKTLVSEF